MHLRVNETWKRVCERERERNGARICVIRQSEV